MKTKHYHNSTDLEGKALETSVRKAKTQEEAIYALFKARPSDILTPFEVQRLLDNQFVPITSIRRAISNLTREEKLVKTPYKKKGEYGALNYTWKLNLFQGQIPLGI